MDLSLSPKKGAENPMSLPTPFHDKDKGLRMVEHLSITIGQERFLYHKIQTTCLGS